jgi:putative addiction module killer protein
VIEVRRTRQFIEWLDGLRDARAVAKIAARPKRVGDGNFGDFASVGEGVGELRIHHGPGYRVYFVRQGTDVVVALCGGDKSTRAHDIELAKSLQTEL